MKRPNEARHAGAALFALCCLVAITAGWWALALWPAGDAPPPWLARARWVCFNATADGLPDASGWLLLVGQPLGMLAVLMAIWGREVRAGLRAALDSAPGRVGAIGFTALLAIGVVAIGVRVVGASRDDVTTFADAPVPDTYPRLDRDAPTLSLVDQHGERLGRETLMGRPALVTFAFGNCQTVCPAVVKQVVAAREQIVERAARGEVAREAVPRVVVVSLDPWRDTPSRLQHLTEHWGLERDDYVVSGPVDEVEDVLDAWNVARSRDPATGDVTHAALVYILAADGRIAYATRGETRTVVELLGRVDRAGRPEDRAAEGGERHG